MDLEDLIKFGYYIPANDIGLVRLLAQLVGQGLEKQGLIFVVKVTSYALQELGYSDEQIGQFLEFYMKE